MNITASEEEVTAAQAYENLHVPALFQQWAPRVIEAANILSGHRVLDVACGTGVLARQALSEVGPNGIVAGVDIAPGMLAVASDRAPSIEWKLAAADSLPYPDNSFDAVVSQFGLMFFPDRKQALKEMLRVLKPNGHLAVAVWDSLENSEAYPQEVDLLERLAGREASNALRAPFVLGDTGGLFTLFSRAGVDSVEVITQHGTAQFPSIRIMVEADLRGWLPIMGVHLAENIIASILDESEKVLAQYVTPEQTVAFDSPAHIVIGRKP